nr:MAG TPA: DNA N-6-adenine-methyltransferase [Caudoviricetes sp.]
MLAAEQTSIFDDNAEYDAFVEKFKQKKTTDDCYTPPLIYDAIRDWACKEYNIDPGTIVRPFYPGADYQAFDYPGGCTVLDNPPFSILTQICTFYLDRGIPFFLFSPSLTAFSGRNVAMRMNHIICDAEITYENGAVVRTAFVTSYGGDTIARTAPELGRKVTEAGNAIRAQTKRTVPKYSYPDNVLTAAMLQRYSKYGVDFSVRRADCALVSALDAQRCKQKTIFGGGLLLSEKAAAEKAAAEIWELSEREKAIIARLGGEGAGTCDQACKYNTSDRGCIAKERGERCDLANTAGKRGGGETG